MLDCQEEHIVVKVTYSQVWWPIFGIRALHLPIQVHTHSSEHTHTQQWTHTPWTHTRSSVQSFMLQRPGSSWGFSALLKSTSLWYWGWRERCTFTPLNYNPCRTWDSNSQPFYYESDSRNINPRLSHNPAGARRLCNVRLTLDITSNRRYILVENENRLIWRWLNVGFWLHNLKTTKSQRQQFNIDIRRWINIEFWSPEVATEIEPNINVLWRCVPAGNLQTSEVSWSWCVTWKEDMTCAFGNHPHQPWKCCRNSSSVWQTK